MTAEISYKTADKNDLQTLIAIRLEMLKQVNNLNDDYSFDDDFVANTKEYFLNGNQTTVLAFDDNTHSPIGCATLSYIYIMPTFDHPTGNRGHLMNVYTNPNYRHKGIASKLVKMLIEEGLAKGITEISLDATQMGEPLYRSLGFTNNDAGMVLELRNPTDIH